MRMIKFAMLALAATAWVSAPAMAAFGGAGTTIIHQLDDRHYGGIGPNGSPKYTTALLTLTGDNNSIGAWTDLRASSNTGTQLALIGNLVYHTRNGGATAGNNWVGRNNFDGSEVDLITGVGSSGAWIQGAFNSMNGASYTSRNGNRWYVTNSYSNTSSDPTSVVQRYASTGFLVDTWLGTAGLQRHNTQGSDNGGTANSGGISTVLSAATWGPDGRYYISEGYRSQPGRITVWDDNGTDGRARYLGSLGPFGTAGSSAVRGHMQFDRFGNLVFAESGYNRVTRVSLGTETDLSDYVTLGQWGDAGPYNPITEIGTNKINGLIDIAIDPRTGRLIAVTSGSGRSTVRGEYLEFSDVNANFRGVIGSNDSPRNFVLTPEPATLGLMGLGSLLLLRRRRRA